MTISHRKKTTYRQSMPAPPPFLLDTNLNRSPTEYTQYFDHVYQHANTRSSSTESSASSTSTVRHVDPLSPNPVIPPKQYLYRRR